MVHVVVDMLYDFIDGSLACIGGEQAVASSVKWINEHPEQKVLYVCDNHPVNHCSFKEFGGIWPVHCVLGSRGAAIHQSFYDNVSILDNKPASEDIFYKGRDASREEYSGFAGNNECVKRNGVLEYKSLYEAIVEHESSCGNLGLARPQVVISGIATEFCVKSTAFDLLEAGCKVSVLKDALAYVDAEGHARALKEMAEQGITII